MLPPALVSPSGGHLPVRFGIVFDDGAPFFGDLGHQRLPVRFQLAGLLEQFFPGRADEFAQARRRVGTALDREPVSGRLDPPRFGVGRKVSSGGGFPFSLRESESGAADGG
ncbi:MAG: hypothetical protein CNCCGFBP_02043 [Fimbriimonadaceae bacterium]|nr:hypothetical protein [Fimbriimonadaceae bacterium]